MSYFTRLGWARPVEQAKASDKNNGHEDEQGQEGEKGKKKKPFGGNQAKPFGQKRVKNKLKFVS